VRWHPSEGVRRLSLFLGFCSALAWTGVIAITLERFRGLGDLIVWEKVVLYWMGGSVSTAIAAIGLTRAVAWVIDGFRGADRRPP
jgi:hypothetical protein